MGASYSNIFERENINMNKATQRSFPVKNRKARKKIGRGYPVAGQDVSSITSFDGDGSEESEEETDLTSQAVRTVEHTVGSVNKLATLVSDIIVAVVVIIKSALVAIQSVMPIVAPLAIFFGISFGIFFVFQIMICPYIPYLPAPLKEWCPQHSQLVQTFPPVAEMVNAQVAFFDKAWTDLAAGRSSYSLTLDRSSRALRDLNTQTKYSNLESRAELEKQLSVVYFSLESTVEPMQELEAATRSTMDALIVFNGRCLDALRKLKAQPKDKQKLAELDKAYQWTMSRSIQKLGELIDGVHEVQGKFKVVNHNLHVLQEIYNPEYNQTNSTIKDLASMSWIWRVLTSKNKKLRLSIENAELLSSFSLAWRDLDEKVNLMKASLSGFKADLKNTRNVVADVELEDYGVELHIQRVELALEHLRYNKIHGKQKEDSRWALEGSLDEERAAP